MSKKRDDMSTKTNLLESDDELPDTYEDIPFTPAYQDDCRFKPIRFSWLDQMESEAFNGGKSVADQYSGDSSPILETDSEETYESSDSHSEINIQPKKVLISSGVLTKRDIFIIKSIEKYATYTTLLWFIDFLNYKAMEPKKIGCLAGNILDNNHTDGLEPLDMKSYTFIINTSS